MRKNALADMAYDDERAARFSELVADELEGMLGDWARSGAGTVYGDTSTAFGRTAFRWAGLPLTPSETDRRARQMSRLLDSFARIATNPVAEVERDRLDTWATGLIRAVRSGGKREEPESVLAALADLRDPDGTAVDDRTSAVELQNLTRPTVAVAVARFAAFAAVALTENPGWAARIREASSAARRLSDIPEAVAFAREVRRVYLFVPTLPAMATADFEVHGCPVHRGERPLAALSAAVAAGRTGRLRAGRRGAGRAPPTPFATAYRAWSRCCADTP
ncbi:hypothetical protein [Dietzia maris]|uniref:hypothetical protein n=1 Tax=Dietzia maris TaxID=37915 RepID=UPI0037C74306